MKLFFDDVNYLKYLGKDFEREKKFDDILIRNLKEKNKNPIQIDRVL
jgi:hypothetical protein